MFDLTTLQSDEDGTYTGVWGPFVLRSGFQPIFRMHERPLKISAFEALIRPMRGGAPVSPGAFFRLVSKEEGEAVEAMTRSLHVLNAGRVIKGDERLFLNFDPSMYNDRQSAQDAMGLLKRTLDRAEIRREMIVCEVTEHRTDEQVLLDLVSVMRSEGFRIAVDDYGADDSDMQRVNKLNPDIIKFDAAWIGHLMGAGSAGEELLHEMVSGFSGRGIETLFEGVEETWQLDLAVRCGVDLLQGFVLAKPTVMPCDFDVYRTPYQIAEERGELVDIRSDLDAPRSSHKAADDAEIERFKEVLGQSAAPEPEAAEPQVRAAPVPKFGGRKAAVFGRRQR